MLIFMHILQLFPSVTEAPSIARSASKYNVNTRIRDTKYHLHRNANANVTEIILNDIQLNLISSLQKAKTRVVHLQDDKAKNFGHATLSICVWRVVVFVCAHNCGNKRIPTNNQRQRSNNFPQNCLLFLNHRRCP